MPVLTRQEAVAEMVDGAIGAWFDDRHACAITLAGAAEGCMPKIDGQPWTFDRLRIVLAQLGNCSEDEAGKMMNISRNWLKHFDDKKADHVSIDNSWLYMVRAYVQFRTTYPDAALTENMRRIEAKFHAEIEPIRLFFEQLAAVVQQIAQAVAKALPVMAEMGRATKAISPTAGVVREGIEPGEAALNPAQDALQDVPGGHEGQ